MLSCMKWEGWKRVNDLNEVDVQCRPSVVLPMMFVCVAFLIAIKYVNNINDFVRVKTVFPQIVLIVIGFSSSLAAWFCKKKSLLRYTHFLVLLDAAFLGTAVMITAGWTDGPSSYGFVAIYFACMYYWANMVGFSLFGLLSCAAGPAIAFWLIEANTYLWFLYLFSAVVYIVVSSNTTRRIERRQHIADTINIVSSVLEDNDVLNIFESKNRCGEFSYNVKDYLFSVKTNVAALKMEHEELYRNNKDFKLALNEMSSAVSILYEDADSLLKLIKRDRCTNKDCFNLRSMFADVIDRFEGIVVLLGDVPDVFVKGTKNDVKVSLLNFFNNLSRYGMQEIKIIFVQRENEICLSISSKNRRLLKNISDKILKPYVSNGVNSDSFVLFLSKFLLKFVGCDIAFRKVEDKLDTMEVKFKAA